MTPDEAAIERSVRAGCDAVDPHLRCSFPECGCKSNPRIVRAALAALLADPPPAIERAVLERLIARADTQEWGGTVRADLWLRRELAELAREESDG